MDWGSAYHKPKRASWGDIAEAIRTAVSMDDAVQFYVGAVPKHHRIPCPIHRGTDYNFFYKDDFYKCYVCNAAGDVIEFVKALNNLCERTDAMIKINADFRLNLPINGEVSATDESYLAEVRRTAEQRKKAREAYEAKYSELWDLYAKYDIAKREQDPDSDEYAEAVRCIADIEYRIDSELGADHG